MKRRGRELDLALAAADVLHPHLEGVAEPVGLAAAAPDECGRELVQLEVVPGKPPGRNIALEDVVEENEQARRDHAGDLTLERRLFPAELEQALLEQPCEAQLVGAVLELRRLPL